MNLTELIESMRDTLSVKRVFGEPYEHNGVVIIPAASVSGGGGGGGGEGSGDESSLGQGSGAGFGASAKPAGAYVITGDTVKWQPAIDVNKVILGGQLVAVTLLLVLRTFVRRR